MRARPRLEIGRRATQLGIPRIRGTRNLWCTLGAGILSAATLTLARPKGLLLSSLVLSLFPQHLPTQVQAGCEGALLELPARGLQVEEGYGVCAALGVAEAADLGRRRRGRGAGGGGVAGSGFWESPQQELKPRERS